MTLYYSIATLLALSSLFELSNNYRIKNSVLWFWVIFFTFFGGLRWETGNDWYQYLDHFLYSDWSNIFNYDRYGNGLDTLEFGFVFINVFIKTIFRQFYWYNIITVFFIMFTQKHILQKLSPFPILCFSLLNIITIHYFGVRQSLSVAVIWWAYLALKENNNVKFLIIIIISFSIHHASIVFLPIIFIHKIRFNWTKMTILYISVILFSYFFREIILDYATLLTLSDIQNKLIHYTEFQSIDKGPSLLGWGLNYVFLCLYLYVRKINNLQDDKWFNTLFNITILYNCIFILFSGELNELVRLNDYFFSAQLLLLINTLYFLRKKNFLFSLYTAFLVFYFFYKLINYGTGYYFEYTCLPYKTIFS